MADIVKTKNVLQLVAEFNDSDTRTINLDNPKANVTASQINAVGTYAKENNVIVGDKEGASFERFNSAKIITGQTTYFDLSE